MSSFVGESRTNPAPRGDKEDSNGRGGIDGADTTGEWADECEGCLCRPSMWSGSGDGIRASGPNSVCG